MHTSTTELEDRIPITTPTGTTPTTTTPTTTTTRRSTTSTTTDTPTTLERESQQPLVQHQEDEKKKGPTSYYPPPPDVNVAIVDIPVEDQPLHCPPSTARSLSWNWTAAGDTAIQPCPPGTTGLARWTCDLPRDSDSPVFWSSTQPDLSDCKTLAMSNLEGKVEDGDLENVISSSLAHLTRVEVLYGGDVEASAAIMRTLSNRIQYLLQTQGDKFYNKGQYIQEVLLNMVRSASNLFDISNRLAWQDLHVSRQVKASTGILLALEENAFLFLEVTNQQEVMVEAAQNICKFILILILPLKTLNVTAAPQTNVDLNNDETFLRLKVLIRDRNQILFCCSDVRLNYGDRPLNKREPDAKGEVRRAVRRDHGQGQPPVQRAVGAGQDRDHQDGPLLLQEPAPDPWPGGDGNSAPAQRPPASINSPLLNVAQLEDHLRFLWTWPEDSVPRQCRNQPSASRGGGPSSASPLCLCRLGRRTVLLVQPGLQPGHVQRDVQHVQVLPPRLHRLDHRSERGRTVVSDHLARHDPADRDVHCRSHLSALCPPHPR